MIIKKLISYIKNKYKYYTFKKNAILGIDFSCTDRSSCTNQSGEKNRIVIGSHCEICGDVHVDKSGEITIGDYTTIRFASSVESTNSIQIDDHVIISNNVIIRDNNSHPTNPLKRFQMSESGFSSELWHWQYAKSAPIHIESNVWIGERVIICKGVTIGKGSIVAAGSIVTKSVPPYVIVAGNPAKIVKQLSQTDEDPVTGN